MTSGSARHPRVAVRVAGLVLAIVGLYALVVVLYAHGSDVNSSEEPVTGDAIVLTLRPEHMDPVSNRLTTTMIPSQTAGSYTDGVYVDESFHFLVSAVAGSKAVEYSRDTLLAPTEVSFLMDGAVEQWPFDTYRVRSVMAAAKDTAADADATLLDTAVRAAGRGISGWDVAVVEISNENQLMTVEITASRSPATIAFGIVLLTLMVIIPVLVLTVAIAVLRKRRKVEVTALGWMGAMLFATIPLRGFLPGAPPVGSWIDYLVVLWVIAALIAGLIVFVTAWWKHGPT